VCVCEVMNQERAEKEYVRRNPIYEKQKNLNASNISRMVDFEIVLSSVVQIHVCTQSFPCMMDICV
jgi:hypothetical protein